MDFKKTFGKIASVFAFGGIVALLGFLEQLPIDEKTAVFVTFLIAVLRGVEDILKHKNSQ